jgi:hypothetical protein
MTSIHLHHVFDYTDVDRAFWREHLEGWLPKRLIDSHVHVVDAALQPPPPSPEIRRQFWVNEVAEPISADGLQRASDICYPGREMSFVAFGSVSRSWDIERSNAYTADQCNRRGWHGLAVLKPEWTQEQLAAQLDRPGIIGVKPYYAMIPGDDGTHEGHIEAGIFDFLPHHALEVLDDRHAWVTLHVPKAQRLGHPDNLREVREIRRRYPRVHLVLAHLGRSYTLPHAREGLLPLADDGGLFFDNSAVMNPDVHRLALEVLGPRRILYGTDSPVFYMRGRRQYAGRSYINRTSYPFHFNQDRESPQIEAGYTLYLYEDLLAVKQACGQLGLTRQDVEDVFYNNARRLIDASNRRPNK